jgi:hypothetical protein
MMALANDSKSTQRILCEISGTLGSLVNKIIDLQIQLAYQNKEKEEMIKEISYMKQQLISLEQ